MPREKSKPIGARLAEGDQDILKFLASFVFLHPQHLKELIPSRSLWVIWRRLRALRLLGYAEYLWMPDNRWGPAAWFLTQKGWDYALTKGWVDERVEWEDRRSNKNLPHDLELSKIHLALHQKYSPDDFAWYQLHLYDRFGSGEWDRVNPDAFFGIRKDGKWRYFFVEFENGDRQKQVNGEPAITKKLRSYARYASGHFEERWGVPNFRVLVPMRTEEKVRNLLLKLSEDPSLASERFWFTSHGKLKNITGKIWQSPANADRRSYALVE